MAEGHDAEAGHVVPLRTLVGVLVALLVLTWVTVAATYVDLGKLNLWVALVIALAKATLVALYFMHLRWDRPINGIIFFVSLALVVLFLGFAMVDTATYMPDRIPGYAPDITR
jgi:cytochrome c oxidase subunit 4